MAGNIRTTSTVIIVALSIILVPMRRAQAQPGIFPLEPNVAVATCQPRAAPAGARFVVGTYDVRDPICDAPPFPTCCNLASGCIPNWFVPIYHNAMPNPTNNAADEWTEANIGLVFGIALDNDANPNIYLTSTKIFFGAGTGTGAITKLDGTSGAISILATLPNSGQGLGNIAFDHRNRQFYVTNHEDGKIYRLDFGGLTLDTFDPFGADDGTPGFAPLDERIWGLQVNQVDGRLYFGTWSEDNGRQAGPANRVYSVDLNAGTGAFVGAEVLEVTLPNLGGGHTQPISDISFSAVGKMLVAERGMSSDTSTQPHNSRILQFVGGHLAWVPGASFQVGIFGCPGNSTNSAGGIDHTDCVEADACNPGPLVMVTADVLDCCGAPFNIYGLSIMPDTGGNILNSWAVDLDADTIDQDKANLGDVEVFRTCVSPPVDCELGPVCDQHICKTVTFRTADGDCLVEVGEKVDFKTTIEVINNTDDSWDKVVIGDCFFSDLVVTNVHTQQGGVQQFQAGNGKTCIRWRPGDLGPGDSGILVVDAETGVDRRGRPEYTRCSNHQFNNGALLRFADPHNQAFRTGPLVVSVLTPDAQGDCDGDGFSDQEELNAGTDPHDPNDVP